MKRGLYRQADNRPAPRQSRRVGRRSRHARVGRPAVVSDRARFAAASRESNTLPLRGWRCCSARQAVNGAAASAPPCPCGYADSMRAAATLPGLR
jgi:hypothetical protein